MKTQKLEAFAPHTAYRVRTISDLDRISKRVLDVMISIALIPLVLPIIALLWVLVRRDGGPGFFGHERVGKGGETFTCWKLRTMRPDAAEALVRHLADDPSAKAEWDLNRKLEKDPRVTGLGVFLRQTSLDELPQILNVLKGEMSLVGPRPVPREELEKYADRASIYLAQRPGITGLWQVFGRTNTTYQQRVDLDAKYYQTSSLGLDISLIARTVVAVLHRTGR